MSFVLNITNKTVFFFFSGIGVGFRLRRQLHGEFHVVREQRTFYYKIGHRRNMFITAVRF